MDSELLVIGGGPAGYTAAIRGAQRGLDVKLVEGKNIGGVCLNHGCIPSKALLSATKRVRDVESATEMGIYAEPYINVGEMVEWKDRVVEQLTQGIEHRCRDASIDIINGFARFEADHMVSIDENETISFENAIIATGSNPIQLPNFDFNVDGIWDAKQALSVHEPPSELIVIGGGYIGMELSTAFARLGSDVTVIELFDEPLPEYDQELTKPVLEATDELGISINVGEAATECQSTTQGIQVTTESDGETHLYEADKALVAIGREPATSKLNLSEIHITTDDSGFIQTDSYGRTVRDHVFAAGDVAGEPMLAHKGGSEGVIAAETIAGSGEPSLPAVIPKVVFTYPEIASVGISPQKAKEEDYDPIVGQFPFSASGRALTMAHTSGFVRIVADQDGQIIGSQVVGPEAGELIGKLSLAINAKLTLSQVAETVQAHPTLSEATMEAAAYALEQAIHTVNS